MPRKNKSPSKKTKSVKEKATLNNIEHADGGGRTFSISENGLMRVASRRMANPLFGENGSEPTPLSPPQRVDDSLYGEESFYAPGAFEIDYSIDSPESVPAPNAAGVKGSTGTRGAQNQPSATSLGDISCADGKRGAGSNGTVEPAYVSAPVVFDGISGNDGGYYGLTPVSIVKSTSDVGQVEEESPYKGFGGAAVIDISAFGEWGGEDTDDEDAGGGGSNAKSARDGTSSKLKSRVPQQDYQTSGMDKAAAIAKMKGKLRQAGSSSSGAGAEPRKRNESVLKKSSLDSIRRESVGPEAAEVNGITEKRSSCEFKGFDIGATEDIEEAGEAGRERKPAQVTTRSSGHDGSEYGRVLKFTPSPDAREGILQTRSGSVTHHTETLSQLYSTTPAERMKALRRQEQGLLNDSSVGSLDRSEVLQSGYESNDSLEDAANEAAARFLAQSDKSSAARRGSDMLPPLPSDADLKSLDPDDDGACKDPASSPSKFAKRALPTVPAPASSTTQASPTASGKALTFGRKTKMLTTGNGIKVSEPPSHFGVIPDDSPRLLRRGASGYTATGSNSPQQRSSTMAGGIRAGARRVTDALPSPPTAGSFSPGAIRRVTDALPPPPQKLGPNRTRAMSAAANFAPGRRAVAVGRPISVAPTEQEKKYQLYSEGFIAPGNYEVGKMDAALVENSVLACLAGDFLIRDSGSTDGKVLCVNDCGKATNYAILRNDKTFEFADRTFPSIDDLVEYVRLAPIKSVVSGDKLILGRPAIRTSWFAGHLPRPPVDKAVLASGHEAFLIRKSSAGDKYVLVINDSGNIVNINIGNVGDGKGGWYFSSRKQSFCTLNLVLESFRERPLAGSTSARLRPSVPARIGGQDIAKAGTEEDLVKEGFYQGAEDC